MRVINHFSKGEGMDSDNNLLTGSVEVHLGWNAFPRHYSGGLFSGLKNCDTKVESDAKVLFCSQSGEPILYEEKETILSKNNIELFDSNAIYHKRKNCILINLDYIPSEVVQIRFVIERENKAKSIDPSKVHQTYIRISNSVFDQETVNSDMSRINSDTNEVFLGSLQRINTGWQFRKFDDA